MNAPARGAPGRPGPASVTSQRAPLPTPRESARHARIPQTQGRRNDVGSALRVGPEVIGCFVQTTFSLVSEDLTELEIDRLSGLFEKAAALALEIATEVTVDLTCGLLDGLPAFIGGTAL
jgi:hypothetical protein